MSERLDADDPCPVRDGFTWPAEWAPHARTWMCWPCRVEAWGGPDAILRAKQAFARVARAISTFEPVAMAVRPHDAGRGAARLRRQGRDLRSAARRFLGPRHGPDVLRGPAGARAAVQWRFNAWGNKYHPYAEDAELDPHREIRRRAGLSRRAGLRGRGDPLPTARATLITTEQCLLNANRNANLTRQEVEEHLALNTGARRVLWLGGRLLGDETDGHIDNIACFVAPGTHIGGQAVVEIPS